MYIYICIYTNLFLHFPSPKKNDRDLFWGAKKRFVVEWNLPQLLRPNEGKPTSHEDFLTEDAFPQITWHKNHQEIGKKKRSPEFPRLRILEKNTSKKCHVCCAFLVLWCVYGERIHLAGFGNLFTQPF